MIAVSDNGTGMIAERSRGIRAVLHDQRAGRGTGLGLTRDARPGEPPSLRSGGAAAMLGLAFEDYDRH